MSYIKHTHDGVEFSFHEVLSHNLDHLKKANTRDWDFKILISGSGMTRTGKTTIASQIAIYLDPTTDLSRVIFRGKDLIKKSLKSGKNKAIIYDEAREGLDSKKAMQRYSQTIIDYFNECGWMNQYLIIVLPDFFELNKSVALNQSIFLINCTIHGNLYRGKFGFYHRKDKRMLYILGKKYNDYSCWRPSFLGDFTSYFPFDKEEYERLKIKNQEAARKEEKVDKYSKLISKVQYRLNVEHKMPQRTIGPLFDMSKGAVTERITQYKQALSDGRDDI